MISQERIEELETYFWEETNDEDTQYWREDLNDKEKKLVCEWDKGYGESVAGLCEEILKQQNSE